MKFLDDPKVQRILANNYARPWLEELDQWSQSLGICTPMAVATYSHSPIADAYRDWILSIQCQPKE